MFFQKTDAVAFLPSDLQKRLDEPLPGRIAHELMATSLARLTAVPPQTAKLAGVLCLLYPFNHATHLVLIKRIAAANNDRHSGQVSFPGGKFDATDETLTHTALRETFEEIGVAKHDVQVLGALTPLYIPVSNFLVHPFVAHTTYRPNFIPQPTEVDYIIELPLHDFFNKDNKKIKNLHLGNGFTINDVPYFSLNGETIWGATAMIISELLYIINPNWYKN